VTILQYDAWFLGRIQAHDDLTPEQLGGVSPRWRAMAERLAGTPLGDRAALFSTMLAAPTGEEADALEDAIDAVDSDGPPPQIEVDVQEADADPEVSWDPLRLGEAPAVEPFPIDVFPLLLQKYCREVAESTHAPDDFVGVSMLTTAGAAVGQSVNIRLKRRWTEPPLSYCVLVADPGKAKTPAIRSVVRPLAEIDARLRDESRRARERWEEARRLYGKDPKAPPPGPEPPQRRAVVKDITRESLCVVLADNPRGVLCAPDEASAWFGSFDQYKARGGTDEQFWLSLHSGNSVSVDRKGGRESTYVRHPFASVLGGIQPDLLRSMRGGGGGDNGFVDRIVFSYPDVFPPQRWTEQDVSPEAERDWSTVIERLHAVEMQPDGQRLAPWPADLTPDAKARFVRWFDEHGRAMDDAEQSDGRQGAMSKAKAMLARWALILSRLRLACDPCRALQDHEGVPPVELADVEGAIRLAGYFESHRARAVGRMRKGRKEDDSKALLDFLRRNRRTEFREAEPKEILRRFRESPDALSDAIRSLVIMNVIRPKAEPAIPGKRGRKSSPLYEVHPALLDDAS